MGTLNEETHLEVPQNLSSHSSVGQKSEVKVVVALVPLGGSEGECVTGLFPGFWGLSATLGLSA